MNEKPALNRTTIRGAEIHYQIQGAGPPVVLVHGSLGDYRSWSLQSASFAARFQVLTYSRRYHFPNRWTDDGLDYSAALHAEDLAVLLNSLQIERAHIVSASYGSYCSLVFAQRYPEMAISLVVAEPPILGWLRELPGGEELIRPFIDNALIPSREAFILGDDEEGVRRFIDGVVGRKGAYDSFHPPIRRALLDNSREMKAETLSDRLFPPFGCGEAAKILAPVLLLSGERSPAFFRRITSELVRCLPRCEEFVFPGVSHNLNSARPRLYNQVVLDFLTRQSGAGKSSTQAEADPGTGRQVD